METIFSILFITCFVSCSITKTRKKYLNKENTIQINELDDQHALAYLLFSGKEFIVKGITVSAIYNDRLKAD